MRVRFFFYQGIGKDEAKVLLDTEMEILPRRDERVVIGKTVYVCTGVKHIFKPTGRRDGSHEYTAEVRVIDLLSEKP
jgi:hypothetical protein